MSTVAKHIPETNKIKKTTGSKIFDVCNIIFMILFILRMGNILNVGYEKILLLYNPSTYEVADVISTYTYRLSFGGGTPQYSYSTAIGLFNTLVTGPGRIVIQTMPVSNFASLISSMIPSKS